MAAKSINDMWIDAFNEIEMLLIIIFYFDVII